MLKRQFQSSPTGQVETGHGVFTITVNSATSIYVKGPETGIVVRGVPLRAAEHWSKEENGDWVASHSKPNSRHRFEATRLDRRYLESSDATPTMNKAALAALQEAAIAFIEVNPRLLLEGEAVRANNEVERTEKEIDDLQTKLHELMTKRSTDLAREASALESLADMPAPEAPRAR